MDENEEESDDQEEEEWRSYPCLPPNFENNVATVIYDNPCYFATYDSPLFIPTIDMHDNVEVCLENLYDNALDDGPMLLDVINYNATKNRISIMCPIPFKSDQSS